MASPTAGSLSWFLRPWLPLAFSAFIVVFSVITWQGAYRHNQSQIQDLLEDQAGQIAHDMEQEFRRYVQGLERMARRRALQPDIDEKIWLRDARQHTRDFPNYQALEWIGPDYRIRWVEPITGNEAVVNYNVAFNETREARLDQAARTGSVDYTGVIDLRQAGPGMVLYAPVGEGERFNGFVAGVFRLAPFIAGLVDSGTRENFGLTLSEAGTALHTLGASAGIAAGGEPDGLKASVPVSFANLTWQLELRPTRAWVERRQDPWTWILPLTFLIVGLLIAGFLYLSREFLRRNQDLMKVREALATESAQRLTAETSLERMASTDELTGMPNRRFFMEDLGHTLQVSARQQHQLALIVLDLDRFQVLNDSLGHAFGDALLVRVAERLTALACEDVMLAHSSGDEFLLYQERVESLDDVIHLVTQVQRCFEAPFQIHGQTHPVTASMGVALFPESGRDAETLLRSADAALFRAKETGRNSYQFYAAGMHQRALERLQLEKDLHLALERDEFVLFMQPQLDLATLQVGSVEALIRWRHPSRGLVPPLEFIPAAEESGLIVPIGRWVLRRACSLLKSWQGTPLGHLRIAVNISGRELESPDLVSAVAETLAYYDVPADCLELELTEEIFIENIEYNLEQLTRLSQMGIRLAIDDFGVGYSSLAYLRNFPVSLLKIDRSFICNVAERHDDAVITRAVINLAHNLGIQVAAEGIETEAQLSFLRAHRCDLIQGYLIGRPMAVEHLEQHLKDHELAQT